MDKQSDHKQNKTIQKQDAQKRYNYLIKEVVKNSEIWLLIDQHGCVMLNSDDQDCIPVWPNQEFAQAWATDEWSHCTTEAISLEQWHNRWTDGLEEDELSIVVFPLQNEDGLIFFPDEFDFELRQAEKNGHKKQR